MSHEVRFLFLASIFYLLLKSSEFQQIADDCGDRCLRPAHLSYLDTPDRNRLDKHRVKKELARVAKGLPRFADQPYLKADWEK